MSGGTLSNLPAAVNIFGTQTTKPPQSPNTLTTFNHLTASECSMGSAMASQSVRAPSTNTKSLNVAVIGAGAAGLAAARELIRAGHKPVVHEQSQQVGGVWVYSEKVEPDSLGRITDTAARIHSSLYANLRTNLPREVMGYLDLPFLPAYMSDLSEDPRRFPVHQEVLHYLEVYARQYGLQEYIRFGSRVVRVSPLPPLADACANMPRWTVETQQVSSTAAAQPSTLTEQYDCVVVGNGHYSIPAVPPIPGAEHYDGQVLHSHNYRRPDAFEGQNVLVLGSANSGTDIAFEVGRAAKKVYWCARKWKDADHIDSTVPLHNNIHRHNMLASLGPGRTARLSDGTMLEDVDVVMYCTGYLHELPFLDVGDTVQTDGEKVSPLYRHVLPPAGSSLASIFLPLRSVVQYFSILCRVFPLYQHVLPPAAASLAFIGLPFEVAPFPLMQLQSAWAAAIWAGQLPVPTEAEMAASYQAQEAAREAAGIANRYAHRLGDAQWAYNGWLLQQLQLPPLPAWRKELYLACREAKIEDKAGYRDGPLEQIPPPVDDAVYEPEPLRNGKSRPVIAVTGTIAAG